MKNLTNKERGKIINISEKFVDIHQKIIKIEGRINDLKLEASSLIKELESCREVEHLFISTLSDKYGEGILDPLTLNWRVDNKKKEIV